MGLFFFFVQSQHPSPGEGSLLALLKQPSWVDFFSFKNIHNAQFSHVVDFWPASKQEIWFCTLIRQRAGQSTCPMAMPYPF